MSEQLRERIQKLLAKAQAGSRREMDRALQAGRITVNGKVAQPGAQAVLDDEIDFEGRRFRVVEAAARSDPQVLIYFKPEGCIVSRDDPEGRRTVFRDLPRGRWIAVGRLDYNTSGLLLFTDDGDLAAHLMHPSSAIDREYVCRVDGELSDAAQAQLTTGVTLDDGPARFTDLTPGEHTGGRNYWYYATLMEGRKHEVRRLFEAVGHTVNRLKRVRFGPLVLPNGLRPKQHALLSAANVQNLMQDVGFTPVGGTGLTLKRLAGSARRPAKTTATKLRRPRSIQQRSKR